MKKNKPVWTQEMIDKCEEEGKALYKKIVLDNSVSHFWDAQAEWSQATFGSDQERGPQGPIKHLKKECDEVLKKPTDIVEYADLLFLAFDAARRAGFTLEQLVNACHEKLEVNKQRKWSKPTSDEPVEHIRDHDGPFKETIISKPGATIEAKQVEIPEYIQKAISEALQ